TSAALEPDSPASAPAIAESRSKSFPQNHGVSFVFRKDPRPAIASDNLCVLAAHLSKPVLNNPEERQGVFLVLVQITSTAPHDADLSQADEVDSGHPDSLDVAVVKAPELRPAVLQLVANFSGRPDS